MTSLKRLLRTLVQDFGEFLVLVRAQRDNGKVLVRDVLRDVGFRRNCTSAGRKKSDSEQQRSSLNESKRSTAAMGGADEP